MLDQVLAPLTFIDENGLTPSSIIQERLKVHVRENQTHKDKIYRLRLLVANHLAAAGYGVANHQVARNYPDQDVTSWEEARHNPLTVNTIIQAKSLAFQVPETEWQQVPTEVSLVRKAYYEAEYDRLRLEEAYQGQVLDLITCGEACTISGVRDSKCFTEYGDILNMTWDGAFRESHRKRFVFCDKQLPKMIALQLFPQLERIINWNRFDTRGAEEPIVLTYYYDQTTFAVFYKQTSVVSPQPNPYERIPVSYSYFFRKPSIEYPTGVAEEQLGNLRLVFRLQRALREKALRAGTLVGVLKGPIQDAKMETVKQDLENAKECVIVSMPPGGDFSWESPSPITEVEIGAYERAIQSMSSESGVDEFQRAQTDTKVDFASRLQLIAQKAGAQGDYAAQRAEVATMESIKLQLDIAKLNENRNLLLEIDGAMIEFNEMAPIKPLLGSDGKLIFKKSGRYEPVDAKLQQVGLLASILQEAAAMPLPLQVRFLRLALEAAEIDDRKEWIEEYEYALQQQLEAEQAQQQQLEEEATLQGSADGGNTVPG